MICGGGGGVVPVAEDGAGVAVIDKDLAAALLRQAINADGLVISPMLMRRYETGNAAANVPYASHRMS